MSITRNRQNNIIENQAHGAFNISEYMVDQGPYSPKSLHLSLRLELRIAKCTLWGALA